MRPNRCLLVIAGLVLTVITAGACGGGSGEEQVTTAATATTVATTAPAPTTAPSTSSTPSPTATAAQPIQQVTGAQRKLTGTILDTAIHSRQPEIENVRYGGAYRSAVSYSGGNLDPKLNNQNISTDTVLTYESLIIWTPNPNDILFHPEPSLAESWNISPDFLTYTFKMRKGIKWQNLPPVNGREVTAEDAAFSLNRYLEKDSYWWGAYVGVDSIKATDRYTVEIKLKDATAWAINDLFPNIQWVVSPELVQEMKGDLGTKIIGTGPYLQKSYAFRRGSNYVRNPDYWKKDPKGRTLPYMDSVEFVFVTDTATVVAGYRTGQFDSGGSFITEDVLALAKSIPNVRITKSDFPSRWGVAFNTRRAPWNDVNVRRAFSMALDKPKFIESVLTISGNWEWCGPFPWSLVSDKELTIDDLGPWYKYNPEESKKLRIAAGYTDGKVKVPSALQYGTPGYHIPRAQILQEMWRKEGIEVGIIPADRAVYQDVYYKREQQDLSTTHQNTGDWSLNWFAQNKFRYEAFQNTSWINDPEVEKVAKAIKLTTDPAKLREHAKFLWEFETLGAYTIWVPLELTYGVRSPRLRNFPGTASFSNSIEHHWLADAPRTSP